MSSKKYDYALEKLRNVLAQVNSSIDIREVVESRDIVLSRYSSIFNLKNVNTVSEEDFRSFLYFENNRHWSGLYRHVNSLTADMGVLRDTLAILLDPSPQLATRFDQALGQIKGFGKGLATAILLVSSPKEYGVWNNTSEDALKKMDIWRDFVRGRTKGQQYENLNSLLVSLSKDIGVDLWTLDALMWGIVSQKKEEEKVSVKPIQKAIQETYSFFDDVQHPVLKKRLLKLSSAPLDTVIREAGVIFESSLRSAGNIDSGNVGVRLVDELLAPGGKLVFSSHEGEQKGIQFLFRGAMQFIRNPPMHKIIDYPENVAKQYLRLIDSLLLLLDQATHVEEVSVDDLKRMLRRRRVAQGQLDLYRVLYNAGNDGLASGDLARALKRTPQQLSGVLGALGRRINQTDGLQDKGGIAVVFDITEAKDDEWLYVMRPVLRKALEDEEII